ncbi:MAG TPA: SAM-dependent methyltransferase, partial [Paraburkholderia sp.]
YLSLWPHRHATDGFFAAVLERRGDPKPAAARAESTEANVLQEALAEAPGEPGQ